MKGLNWNLEGDRNSVTLSLPTAPPVALKLNVMAVTDILRNLGDLRAKMRPPVEAGWPPGQKFQAIANPRWATEPEMMLGNSVLHIRDPRYGWLHYVLPRKGARKLAGLLAAQADAPAPVSPPGKTN
jgi:hypothetical protein